jgi:outer membrane receptor protein involved in Fe transport
MNYRTFLSLLFCSTLFTSLFANPTSPDNHKDTGKILGQVIGVDGHPLSFANVLLYQVSDSALVKAEYTDENGTFELQQIAAGKYWINVTYVGLPEYNTKAFEISTNQVFTLPEIRMSSGGVELTEVVVKTSRPIVEVHADKTVFNVDGSVNATGSDAMELLRKAPGVVVDNNDNIMVSGKNGVQVYINDKPTYLSTSDLAAYLKSIQSTEIDNIEIITNPNAKWDAEGNAGIINIKMKKDKRLGANGSVDLGYQRGEYNNYNTSLSGNYRNKKMNTFGRYSYNDRKGTNFFNLYREQVGLSYDQTNPGINENQSHNFRLGNDFFLNDKNTLGVLVTGYDSEHIGDQNSSMLIRNIGSTIVDSSLLASTLTDSKNANYNFNLNYRFDNGKGIVWNLDGDYGLFRNDTENNNPNYIYDGLGRTENDILSKEEFLMVAPTDIDIYTMKVDHERPFLKGQLSTGVKYSLVSTDNDFKFYNIVEGKELLDEDRTNRFVYDENVNAVYANYAGKTGKWGYQAGLRIEQTISEGDLTAMKPVNDQNVKRDYIDYFPSAGLTWTANEKNQFGLTYSRRIDRPSYQDLNPFEGRLDKLTFEKGNPFLRPQYTHSVGLTHTYAYRFNTSLTYSKTTDLITRLTDIDERNESASFITYENLANQENISLNISAPLPITKWWNAYANISTYYTHNTADFGDGKIIDLDVWAYNLYAQNTFNLPKGIVFELSGWYSSPSIWGGNFKTKRMGAMDMGLQKKFMEDKATLKIALSDVFKTNEWSFESFYGALYIRGGGGWDSRRLRVNLTYRFGNDQVKGARRRSTGLEDEKKRVKGE